jgi:hypothetical protein
VVRSASVRHKLRDRVLNKSRPKKIIWFRHSDFMERTEHQPRELLLRLMRGHNTSISATSYGPAARHRAGRHRYRRHVGIHVAVELLPDEAARPIQWVSCACIATGKSTINPY